MERSVVFYWQETVLLLPYPFCLFDEAAATGFFAISCCCLTDCKVTHFF